MNQNISTILIEMDNKNRAHTKDSHALWENTFIKHQIDKRKNGGTFTVTDHIRAMVYSMLSSGISWNRVDKYNTGKNGELTDIDTAFHDYDVEYLLRCSPEELTSKIKDLKCASKSTGEQMRALINNNIPRLQQLEEKYGSVDKFYKTFIDKDNTLKSLVCTLSHPDSENKLAQLGIALTAEYLRNVGNDIAKPDRHICRILCCKRLGLYDSETVPPFAAFDIVADIAKATGRAIAETDYILWSYCSNGFCTKRNSKCESCVIKK